MTLSWVWLKKNYLVTDSSFVAIASVFITVTLWFLIVIFLFTFLSSLIPWLLLLLNKKKHRITVDVKTSTTKNSINEQEIFLSIHPIITPVFGNIRIRLLYEQNKLSEKFTVSRFQQNEKWFQKSISGYYRWPLPDIKEYKVTALIIYLEDMFQFFSFATILPAGKSFIIQPSQISTPALKVQPKKSHDTNVRIERIRKVEGELLNYKNFENNDDIRRIVWKIYAKNKELVVRVPETNDPYASHIYFYASFYNAIKLTEYYPLFNQLFLNHFKTVIWNCYFQLNRQNQQISYIPDQEIKTFYADDPVEKVKLIISTVDWHSEKNIRSYFKTDDGSVLCISSLTDAVELRNLLHDAGKDLVVVFVILSKALSPVRLTDWFTWLLIKPGKDSLQSLKLKWNFSPLKNAVISNEKIILNILKESDCEITMI
jgi:hypothetical protein